jgi:hypothetical protein
MTSLEMKNGIQNTKKGELLIYSIIWLVVFLMPFFLSYTPTGMNWNGVTHEWIRFLPFILVFLLHNFFLFPLYFGKERKFRYFVITLFLLLAICTLWIVGGRMMIQSSGMEHMPPPGFSADVPPPPQRLKPWFVNLAEIFMISLLVVGFNATIKLTIKGQVEEQKNKELEKEKLQTELAFLRNQVSPHFLMNTLNNIHALVDLNPEDAKVSIVKLSRLMRYLLYDSENGKTKLSKEIEFIKSYVDLMKLRLVSNVDIQLSFPDEIPDVEIPPLLFISLVENAFKHGISYQSESYIRIFMQINDNQLFFRIKNSLHKNTKNLGEGGLGFKNLKKRLELIYGIDFSLSTTENENSFETNIKLPLYGN